MLYLAMSCYQARPMRMAWRDLCALHPDGIQLTPGNIPEQSFQEEVQQSPLPTLRHHGFSWLARKQPVWDADGRCLVSSESVHPPSCAEAQASGWQMEGHTPLLETMYPGQALGTGLELEAAMDAGVRLAVDVSHLFIQQVAGVLRDSTWRRLQDYPHIGEVHLSANEGRHDAHQPIHGRTFGLAWAREKLRAGTPVVLECYMHSMSRDQAERQLDLCRP